MKNSRISGRVARETLHGSVSPKLELQLTYCFAFLSLTVWYINLNAHWTPISRQKHYCKKIDPPGPFNSSRPRKEAVENVQK